MDITDTSVARFSAGIELFLEGQTLVYEDVVFFKDKKSNKLSIQSFSNGENATEDEAKQKIERSKAVFDALCKKSIAFTKAVQGMKYEYCFCYDYGMGSIALAYETDSQFTWMAK